MVNDTLIKLQHFLYVDTRIKKEMYNNVPPTINGYFDEDTMCKYTKHLNESLTYIFSELKCVSLEIFGDDSPVLKRVEELESLIKNEFYYCGLNATKLQNFYKKYISNMDPGFIDEVKANCFGYNLFYNLPINMATSINEILHLIHSHVVNNENILQAIPIIAEKTNNHAAVITLRGISINCFEQLFNQFPSDLDVGFTDMVSLNDKKLLMMIRDIGHALTIEITLNNDTARLEYFIPILRNIDMVNRLPGVNKVKDDSVGTTGVIETYINCLSEVLFDFIAKVPTDYDKHSENVIR